MLLNTLHFGDLDIPENKIIHFEHGLMGFETMKDFTIVNNYDTEDPVPFFWMQSVNDPELAFVLTVPFIFKPDYEFELPQDIEQTLHITDQSKLGIYSIVKIPHDIKDFTYNLQSPIVVNYDTKEAEQVVLYDDKYSVSEHYQAK